MFLSPIVRDILINGIVAKGAVKTAKKNTAGWGCFALAGLVLCLAFVFMAVGGYEFLKLEYLPHIAAMMVSGVIVGIAFLIGSIGYYRMAKTQAPPKPHHPEGLAESIEEAFKSFLDGLDEPVRENPKMAMAMAALAGFTAADKFR